MVWRHAFDLFIKRVIGRNERSRLENWIGKTRLVQTATYPFNFLRKKRILSIFPITAGFQMKLFIFMAKRTGLCLTRISRDRRSVVFRPGGVLRDVAARAMRFLKETTFFKEIVHFGENVLHDMRKTGLGLSDRRPLLIRKLAPCSV